MKKRDLAKYMPERIKGLIEGTSFDFELLTELRLRAGKPVIVRLGLEEYFLCADGGLCENPAMAYLPERAELSHLLELLCRHSLYAYEDDLRRGFVSLPGGHRAGVCGEAVTEDGKIRAFKNVSSVNIRAAHEVKGCADRFMNLIVQPELKNIMIISPPGCGKTTLLRDMVRQLSDGGACHRGYTIGLVDERSEIAACDRGVAQNDVGIRTDVYDALPKQEAMRLLLRSMSPEIIAVDELDGRSDMDAVSAITNSGVKLICTAHGADLCDVNAAISDRVFGLYIVLSGVGRVKAVYDGSYGELAC